VASGKPFIIENVMTAPLDRASSVVLCGCMFGLRTYRRRRFEPGNGLELMAPPCGSHEAKTATRDRKARWEAGWNLSVTGRNREGLNPYWAVETMDIDWMTGPELSEAISPRYTHFLGDQLADHLRG
jgi:DNA (cytosine-5)-methyltransferase 1